MRRCLTILCLLGGVTWLLDATIMLSGAAGEGAGPFGAGCATVAITLLVRP